MDGFFLSQAKYAFCVAGDSGRFFKLTFESIIYECIPWCLNPKASPAVLDVVSYKRAWKDLHLKSGETWDLLLDCSCLSGKDKHSGAKDFPVLNVLAPNIIF